MANSNPLQTAIPLGRGRGTQEVYHFSAFLRYIGKDGKEINPWSSGEWVDPKADPNYDHTEPRAFKIGEVVDMPYWDSEFIKDMLAIEDFARPGMAEKIAGWIKDGLESYDLVAKVREEKGLVTLKDFGVEEAPAQAQEQPQQGG
jgi:hypothetical protein